MRGKAFDGWLRVDADGVRTKRQLERGCAAASRVQAPRQHLARDPVDGPAAPDRLARRQCPRSRLAEELRQSIGVWDPADPDTSLHIADAARRLAALARREIGDPGRPLHWDLHAEVDALVSTLDDLDQAMRATAADGKDVERVLAAAVAMASYLNGHARLLTVIVTRSGLLPRRADEIC